MKKILFIAPPFYEYPILIRRELERRFDEVDYYTSSPTSFLYRVVAFLRLRSLQRKIAQIYNDRIIRNSDNEYDYVFIIKASELGAAFMRKLHDKIKAKYVQYIWDDLKFDRGAIDTFPYFDRILSFCPQDSKKYNLVFRTNFFDPHECHKHNKDIDLLFIGSYKANRVEFLKKILLQISKTELSVSFNIKCGLVLFVITPSLWKYRRYVIFRSLSYKKMMDLLSRSVAMIDVAEKFQEGLTTRPFEAMAVDTKIITTNINITEYNFYSKENVMVVDEKCPQIKYSWLKDSFAQIPESIMEKYSIQAFVDDVIK